MAGKKVKLKDQLGRVVLLNDAATEGATLGVNLYGPDGKLLKASQIINPPADDGGAAATVWKLIREVPANLVRIAALEGKGIAVRQESGEWGLRLVEPGDGITVENGDGEGGNIVVGLADVPDLGQGRLLAVTVDAKGRVTGSRPATITGTEFQIDVENGDAAAGLPALALAAEVLASLDLADSAVQEVVAGAGIDVDNTDPRRPIVSATGGVGGSGILPVVSGEIVSGQPVFLIADDGNLIYTEII